MISPNPENWTVTSLSKALRKREISPVEITRAYLERIQSNDPKINSFITLLPREALWAARQAEKERGKGKVQGPLHGIPFAAKDLFFTKGVRTTCGSKILKNFIPAYNATVIERLQAAGAILLGKLNMHEFAYGTTSVNPHFGAVRNPWDRERVPGGSSGGSAAALACSFVPLTLGTDTGGSIRIPSALCGTAGLKPTFGRVSKYGVYPLCWSLDHPGPMTRCVADLAIAMNVLAGPDPLDSSTSPVAVPDYTRGLSTRLKGVHIGVPDTYYFERLDPEVRARVLEAIRVFKALGAAVKNISIPLLPEASIAAFILLLAEGAATLEKWHRTRPMDLGDDVRSRINLGAAIMATQYLKAQAVRRKIRETFSRVFQKVDVIVTPQLPITAPKIGQGTISWGRRTEAVPSALTRFTRIYNLVGIPSLSIPCGFSKAGLPVGLQVAGKPFDEATVLKVGHAYESNTAWKDCHPRLDG
ncbi:MAG TPA: amidase [Thermodesulfobacteriota bacterium]|nr:amidase [Thermodesulfobacteriota bacterium]